MLIAIGIALVSIILALGLLLWMAMKADAVLEQEHLERTRLAERHVAKDGE